MTAYKIKFIAIAIFSIFLDTQSFAEDNQVAKDPNAVCEFAAPFFNQTSEYLSKNEWKKIKTTTDVKNKKVILDNHEEIVVYEYKRKNIVVEYTLKNQVPLIWKVTLSGSRIPKEMQDKKFFIKNFEIAPQDFNDRIETSCDNNFVTVSSHKDKVNILEIEMSSNAI